MAAAPRFTSTGTEELPKDVVQLGQMIAALPNEHRAVIEPVWERVVESTRRRRRILSLVQEALSQLRLDMKYLVFRFGGDPAGAGRVSTDSGDDGQCRVSRLRGKCANLPSQKKSNTMKFTGFSSNLAPSPLAYRGEHSRLGARLILWPK